MPNPQSNPPVSESNAKRLITRLVSFASEALDLPSDLPSDYISTHIARQLMRASTAAGALYAEACGAESRRDFIHELRIADKEMRESRYWLELIGKRWSDHTTQARRLMCEGEELDAILTASIRTAESRLRS